MAHREQTHRRRARHVFEDPQFVAQPQQQRAQSHRLPRPRDDPAAHARSRPGLTLAEARAARRRAWDLPSAAGKPRSRQSPPFMRPVRSLVVSLALGTAAALFGQAPNTGQLVLRSTARDVTLLTGPYLLSAPKTSLPKTESVFANPPPATDLKVQPLNFTPLAPSAYSLRGSVAAGVGAGVVSAVPAEITAAREKRDSAEGRLQKLKAEREAALRRKAELDALIEPAQREAPPPTTPR